VGLLLCSWPCPFGDLPVRWLCVKQYQCIVTSSSCVSCLTVGSSNCVVMLLCTFHSLLPLCFCSDRAGSISTLDSLDFARYSDDGNRESDDRVAGKMKRTVRAKKQETRLTLEKSNMEKNLNWKRLTECDRWHRNKMNNTQLLHQRLYLSQFNQGYHNV